MMLAGCSFEQSVLHPAGRDAEGLTVLTWFMFAAAVVVWGIVMGAAIYAVVGKRRPRSEKFADTFILVGGVAFPTVGLAVLLVFGLSLLPSWTSAEAPDLRVNVRAEQYWWRLGYELPGGAVVETANELHLPNDATVEFVLSSTDVIHSFWIPALGGKMDAIPGRTNVLRLTPTKPGTYLGVCAEFCGPSHALMAFPVVVHEAAEFPAWLEAQQSPAVGSNELFIGAGCGACHAVRGVSEAGAVGPDLTHFASRSTIGAGTLPNTRENLLAWLAAPAHIKPGVGMPSYASLPETDRAAIADYLMELR
ncbi:MAG: cytochrome c oxidase subunit II [Alphaproteobacteria bacterium]|nr:MAG: cytochrome c oxidase subunit II [Alphaproteobacteria bacterium]